MNGLTTSEAAERLGVPKTTLHTWLNTLPIPSETDSRGRKRLDANALAVLEAVKELRGEDCGYQTIRRRIGTLTEHDGTEPERVPNVNGAQPEPAPAADRGAFLAQVVEVVANQTDLAERYARAAHQIGTLEERTRGLELERDRLAGELAEVKAERDQARALLAAPARPWWKFWS